MRVTVNNTMAMIIDFQERLMPVIADYQEVIKRTDILIRGLKILEVPTIVTRQYPKGLGDTVRGLSEAVQGLPVLDKVDFCAYDDEEIRKEVDKLNRKNIIVCGAESHICVQQTALGLKEAGFQPIFVIDCAGSRFLSDKKVAVSRAKQEGITIATSEAILFELTKKSGTDIFKAISNLIK